MRKINQILSFLFLIVLFSLNIQKTYAAKSTATRQGALYDSYIRAFRWASDRIGDEGVIGFVTNAGWVDSIATDGFRKCLAEEFSKIFLFHLRGNARTKGELRRKEKGNVFGGATKTPIVIAILVKKKRNLDEAEIFFHDVGDYLDKNQKLTRICDFKSINGILEKDKFVKIQPDENGNWLNTSNPLFAKAVAIGNKKNTENLFVFKNYSNGLKTSRDAWNYNFSKQQVSLNVKKSINFYNQELQRYQRLGGGKKVEDFLKKDSKFISWDRPERQGVERNKVKEFHNNSIVQSLYRPFTKTWLYSDRNFNNCVYQIPKIFPDMSVKNRVISITGNGNKSGFSCLMTDLVPDVQLMFNGQSFPLELFEQNGGVSQNLFISENFATTKNYRNHIAYVDQQNFLFNRTITIAIIVVII